MDSITHEMLNWKHIQTERVNDYKYLLTELLVVDLNDEVEFNPQEFLIAN